MDMDTAIAAFDIGPTDFSATQRHDLDQKGYFRTNSAFTLSECAQMAAAFERIKEQEARQLEVKSQPIKDYLMKYVVPTLSEGLLEVCKLEPEDPIQYLADYLIAHAEDCVHAGTQEPFKGGT